MGVDERSWMSDEQKSDESSINIKWKSNGNNVTDGTMDATTLQSAHEFRNDGRRDTTTMALWSVCELCGDGRR
jgi:hypothetical protein